MRTVNKMGQGLHGCVTAMFRSYVPVCHGPQQRAIQGA
jgi:hypothetical protein